jgi:hypothetical protein
LLEIFWRVIKPKWFKSMVRSIFIFMRKITPRKQYKTRKLLYENEAILQGVLKVWVLKKLFLWIQLVKITSFNNGTVSSLKAAKREEFRWGSNFVKHLENQVLWNWANVYKIRFQKEHKARALPDRRVRIGME